MSDNGEAVAFYLGWFDRITEKLVGEHLLAGVSKQQVSDWLQLEPEIDPVSGSFPVPPESLALIASQYHVDVDGAAYDYFITAFQPED